MSIEEELAEKFILNPRNWFRCDVDKDLDPLLQEEDRKKLLRHRGKLNKAVIVVTSTTDSSKALHTNRIFANSITENNPKLYGQVVSFNNKSTGLVKSYSIYVTSDLLDKARKNLKPIGLGSI